MLLLRELGMVGGTLVAVDGALFHGNASKDSIYTRRKLAKQIANLDQEIEAYGKSLDTNDTEEAKQPADGSEGNKNGGGDVGDKMKQLMAKRERARADLKDLETGDKGQVSKTDPDARLLSKGDQTIAGYNVQSVVDDKYKLIIASEVVNRSDAGHLHALAKAAKEVLEAKSLQVLADAGYYNSADLKACEDVPGIKAYVPMPRRQRRAREARPLRPQGLQLRCCDRYLPLSGRPIGCIRWRAACRPVLAGIAVDRDPPCEPQQGVSDTCQLRARCLAPKATQRIIGRWEPRCSRNVIVRMASEGAGELMRRRSAIVEHPFGTLQVPRRLSALILVTWLRQGAW